MKIPTPTIHLPAPHPHSRRGFAVIVVLALITLVLLASGMNMRSLHYLGQELKLVEQKQIRRLDPLSATNRVELPPLNPNPNL